MLLACIASFNLELDELGAKTVFLNFELEEEIYMRQCQGFVVLGKEHCVCRLKRPLYGVKQALRQWYKRFDSFMTG